MAMTQALTCQRVHETQKQDSALALTTRDVTLGCMLIKTYGIETYIPIYSFYISLMKVKIGTHSLIAVVVRRCIKLHVLTIQQL